MTFFHGSGVEEDLEVVGEVESFDQRIKNDYAHRRVSIVISVV